MKTLYVVVVTHQDGRFPLGAYETKKEAKEKIANKFKYDWHNECTFDVVTYDDMPDNNVVGDY